MRTGGDRIPQYPVALARISASWAAALTFERRIGRFVGKGLTEACFSAFYEEIAERARESVSGPVRFLSLTHLKNSIATRIVDLDPASRDLIEGFVFQLIKERSLLRLPTISRKMKPYQVLYWHHDERIVQVAKDALHAELKARGNLTLQMAKRVTPRELASREQHVELLFGHFLYMGIAATDAAPDCVLDSIRLPYAAARL